MNVIIIFQADGEEEKFEVKNLNASFQIDLEFLIDLDSNKLHDIIHKHIKDLFITQAEIFFENFTLFTMVIKEIKICYKWYF